MEKQFNTLLNVRSVMSELGLGRNDRSWRDIRKILICEYGMNRIGNSGFRIPRRNLEKFIADHYQI